MTFDDDERNIEHAMANDAIRNGCSQDQLRERHDPKE